MYYSKRTNRNLDEAYSQIYLRTFLQDEDPMLTDTLF